MRTFEQLKEIFMDATPETWHQHKNGGGWVQNTVKIDETVFVGDNAIITGGEITGGEIYGGVISGTARIYGGEIYGTARIYGGEIYGGVIYGTARIYGGEIYGTARIYGGEIYGGVISGTARIYGGVISGGVISGGVITGGEWNRQPLHICGTRFSLSNCKPGHIQIGCHCLTYDKWLEKGEAIADENNFTAEEKTEYRAYIELFKKIGK